MTALTGHKSLYVITGASRGIGRQIAFDAASKTGGSSAFLITARNESAMLEVKNEMRARNDGIKVWIVVCDMADLNDETKKTFDTVMREITEETSFDSLFLFHNAGFLGDVSKKALKLNDTHDWTVFLSANLINMVVFNNLILKWITHLVCPNRYVINMSSILAVQAFPSFTQHACGKAAREAFFRGLAVEEPSLRVLNYCPGPVLTDMYRIVQEKSYDASIRETYSVDSKSSSEVHQQQLSPEETVAKLLKILDEDKYESGGRVDYFDYV